MSNSTAGTTPKKGRNPFVDRPQPYANSELAIVGMPNLKFYTAAKTFSSEGTVVIPILLKK